MKKKGFPIYGSNDNHSLVMLKFNFKTSHICNRPKTYRARHLGHKFPIYIHEYIDFNR